MPQLRKLLAMMSQLLHVHLLQTLFVKMHTHLLLAQIVVASVMTTITAVLTIVVRRVAGLVLLVVVAMVATTTAGRALQVLTIVVAAAGSVMPFVFAAMLALFVMIKIVMVRLYYHGRWLLTNQGLVYHL